MFVAEVSRSGGWGGEPRSSRGCLVTQKGMGLFLVATFSLPLGFGEQRLLWGLARAGSIGERCPKRRNINLLNLEA